jgi:lipoprotein-releasing system ATP-binding protein
MDIVCFLPVRRGRNFFIYDLDIQKLLILSQILIEIKMLLKVKHLTKSYQTANDRPILNNLDMELASGETAAILGPSGSGKSTLLNIIGTLDKPDSGEVLVAGNNIVDLTDMELAAFRSREIGFVFQSHHLLPQCTVLENVLIPTLTIRDEAFKKACKVRAMELIKEVGLWNHKDKFPGTLSGGECQRVAVVRALINEPKIILADEPTGSLDHSNAMAITELLLKLNHEFNTSLIVVTHAEEIGRQMASSYQLVDGQLKAMK